jgi:hypothetical protein
MHDKFLKSDLKNIQLYVAFAKNIGFRSENHCSYGHDLKNGGPMSQ